MERYAGTGPAADAVGVRDDEFAEMELRILVALYDAWPGTRDVRSGDVYRPAGRYTGPGEAPAIMRDLLARRATGHLGPTGLTHAKLEPAERHRLQGLDARGTPWIDEARAVIAEACSPVTRHAKAVRDGLRG